MNLLEQIQAMLTSNRVCSCGKKHRLTLKRFELRKDAVEDLPSVLRDVSRSITPRVVLICGENGYRAIGKKLEFLYPFAQTILLEQQYLHADEKAVEIVGEQLQDCDLLVAADSSTLHDIVKYIAQERGLPFVSVPTAATVDGYVSSVSAMTWHGVKKSLPAVAPVAVVADTNVIAGAPPRLTISGIGELVGNYVSVFDWRVAHLLAGEDLCEEIVRMELDAMEAVLQELSHSKSDSPEVVQNLMLGLIVSGLAMQMVGSSRPASGAEHHLSHLIEMGVVIQGNRAMHGEKVGVCSGIICDYYHKLLARKITTDDIEVNRRLPVEMIRHDFGELADEILRVNTPDPLGRITRKAFVQKWPEIQRLARETLPTGEAIRNILRDSKAPATLTDIGVPEESLGDILRLAPYVRSRLTLLRAATLLR